MFKRTKISAAAVLAIGAMVGGVAIAQDGQRVEITGSSIKRVDGESAAPVQVLRRADIEATGATSVEQLLRSVASMVSSNVTAAASSSGATTGGISTLSLRGLSSTRTLVLINGKRTAPYGAPGDSVSVDIDSIPISAIERVEILKDGASAIYGSDAIAGVVNFIMRKDVVGGEVSASYGAATQDGNGSVAKASVLYGFGDLQSDRWNVMVMGSIQRDGNLLGADRDFAKSGIRLDKNQNGASSRTVPGNISIPGVGVRNPLVNGATQTGDCGPQGTYEPGINPNICLFDTGPYVTLLPETDRWSLGVNGRYAPSDSLSFFFELAGSGKEATTVIQPSPIDSAFGIPFTLTTASPFYPTAFVQGLTGGATPNLNVRYRPFIIGNRDLTDEGRNLRGVLGVEGNAVGWDYDASLLTARSKVTETLNGGYFRAENDSTGPGIVPLLSGQTNGANGQPLWLNPFGDNSAEVAAAAKATNFVGTAFETETSITSLRGKASRELMALAGGGLSLALGAEARNESYKLESSPALETGNISGYGGSFVPVDVSRRVYGLFAEIAAPVTKMIEVDAAVRYDGYQSVDNPFGTDTSGAVGTLQGFSSTPSGDVLPAGVVNSVAGSTIGDADSFSKATGKVGLRFRPMDEILVRATYSTGFRAPALTDLFGPLQSGVSPVVNDPQKCVGADSSNPEFCATQFNTYSGGNRSLEPEESTSATLGIVLEPIRNLSVGVDYFHTKVENLIGVNSVSDILENPERYPGQVTRGASGEIIAIDQRLTNTDEVEIEGLDFDVRARVPTPVGNLTLGWNATYFSKWDQKNNDGSVEGQIGQTSSSVSGFIPRFRYVLSGTFETQSWAFNGQYNWQSGGVDVCGNLEPFDDFGNCLVEAPRFSSYGTFDAQVRYNGITNLAITFGLRNLFNEEPPYVNGSGGAFQSGYDPTWADPRGRYAYLTVTYKF